MNKAFTPTRVSSTAPLTLLHSGVLQRACACGGTPGPTGECAECRRKKRLGVGSLPLQPKLRINRPGDRYEQEADRVAEQVMRMPAPDLQRQVDEKEEEELLQTKPLVQRRITGGGDGGEAPPIVHKVLQSPGRPLDPATRAFFEPRFSHDFSQVRVHTDALAAESAHMVNARAFTVGQDIVFGAGQYVPKTQSGQRLLAHELVHTLQQPNETSYLQLQSAENESERQAQFTEEEIAEAGLIATGRVLQTAVAPEAETLRNIYNQGAARIVAERARLQASGLSEQEIARRLSQMRHELALEVRRLGSNLMRKGAEVFDRVRGNIGRPTYESLRAAGKTDAQIIESAARTNRFINRLPHGLRWTGKALLFISAGISVYVITTAPPEHRGQVIQEEVGGFFGGILGTSVAQGLCVITGIATEGLGLIVCGLLGGVLGFEIGREGSIWQILDIAPHSVSNLAGRIFRIEGDWDVTDLFLFSIVHRRVEPSEHVLVISTGMVSGEMIGGRGHYRRYEVIPANRAAEDLFGGKKVKWVPNYLLTPASQADLLAGED